MSRKALMKQIERSVAVSQSPKKILRDLRVLRVTKGNMSTDYPTIRVIDDQY